MRYKTQCAPTCWTLSSTVSSSCGWTVVTIGLEFVAAMTIATAIFTTAATTITSTTTTASGRLALKLISMTNLAHGLLPGAGSTSSPDLE